MLTSFPISHKCPVKKLMLKHTAPKRALWLEWKAYWHENILRCQVDINVLFDFYCYGIIYILFLINQETACVARGVERQEFFANFLRQWIWTACLPVGHGEILSSASRKVSQKIPSFTIFPTKWMFPGAVFIWSGFLKSVRHCLKTAAARHCGCNGGRVSLIKSQRVHLDRVQAETKAHRKNDWANYRFNCWRRKCTIGSRSCPRYTNWSFGINFYNRFHLESAQIPAKANPQKRTEAVPLCCVLSSPGLCNVSHGHVTTIHTWFAARFRQKLLNTQQLWRSFAPTNWFATCDSPEWSYSSCRN